MNERKTSVSIDTELLRAAQEILGTRTIRKTLDAALREVVRAQARRDEVKALTEMSGMDLDDEAVMAGAWRSS